MAWICLAASEASDSPSNAMSAPSPIVNLTDSPKLFYCSECDQATFPEHQSGMTCKHSTPGFCQKSTSFTADSPVRTSVRRDLERAWLESEAVFISKSKDLPKKLALLSSFLKTSLQSGHADLDVWSGDFPNWGMIVDGQLYQPPMLAPPTSEKGGSYLPTPRANDGEKRGDFDSSNRRNGLPAAVKRFYPTPTASDYGNNQGGGAGRVGEKRLSLSSMARQMWPTPKASDGSKGGPNCVYGDGQPQMPAAAARWATPKARDHKGRNTPKRHGRHSVSIDIQVAENGHHGFLNPAFVEAIMGYSLGWTALEDWAIRWFRPKHNSLSKS